MSKRYIYYFCNEREDDFANTKIKTKVTPCDYKYYYPNIFYRVYKKIVYSLIVSLCFVANLFLGVRFKNKRVLKDLKDKKKGYFIYGNHTSYFEDAVTGHLLVYPRNVSVICNPDAISIKGLKHLVQICGAYPVPTYKETYINFVKDMDRLINKGQVFVIYPEAHIWPHYNKIRDFTDSSFYYPVKFNVPAFSKTTIYTKNKFGIYKMKVYIDGPFYPDKNLPFNQAKQKLCNEVKNKMIERVQTLKSKANPRFSYVKVYKNEDVRIEQIID